MPRQHVDNDHVIVGDRAGGAQFDILVLQLGEDQAHGGEAGLVAGLHRGDLGGLDRITKHGLSLFRLNEVRSGDRLPLPRI